MDREYRQDLCKRTMVVKREDSEKSSFREKMVIKNSIRGLSKLNIRFLNGESCYSYEMGSCQTLKNVFDGNPMSLKELKSLFSSIVTVAGELEKYLLDIKDLLMEPEHIFWDLERMEPIFCYYPDNPEGEEGYNALGLFLMDAVDKEDEEAVKAAYGYFDRICEGILLPGDLRETAEDPGEERREEERHAEKEERGNIDSVFEGDSDSLALSNIWDEGNEDNYYLEETFSEKKGDKKKGRVVPVLFFMPALLAAAAYAYIFMNPSVMAAFSFTDSDYVRCGILVTIISGLFITIGIYFWNRRRKEEEDREKDMDSLNSDLRNEEFSFDPLEEKAFESAARVEDSNDATVLLSDLKGKGGGNRTPRLSGRIRGEERTFRIERTPYMIGKMRSKADACIPDPGVSRIHACIREEDGRYYLSDLNSTNGTAVNEKLLKCNETAELSDGDSVRFGDVSLIFRLA